MPKKDSEHKSVHEIEVAVLPRDTWESVKGLREVFEEALQEANDLRRCAKKEKRHKRS